MEAHYKYLVPDNIKGCKNNNGFALEVLNGLSKEQKMIPCKFFYNERGEQLFRSITELPEYYLTNSEFEILQNNKDDIANAINIDDFNLVELGAGDGKKTKVLLEHFSKLGLKVTYIPIDICDSAIKNLIHSFTDCPIDISINGLVAEYFQGLKWLSQSGQKRNLLLFLGSNIGNFTIEESRRFFYKLWSSMNPGDFLLIGFDMKKDIELLNKAYNDSENVTAEFNLNLLHRINNELGGNFNPSAFDYSSSYDVETGAVESYLVSTKTQTVYIDALDRSFSFKNAEAIHTESSHKYSRSDIKKMAEGAGFEVVQDFTDSKNYFLDSLWRVKK